MPVEENDKKKGKGNQSIKRSEDPSQKTLIACLLISTIDFEPIDSEFEPLKLLSNLERKKEEENCTQNLQDSVVNILFSSSLTTHEHGVDCSLMWKQKTLRNNDLLLELFGFG
jgi:hypothetical protein